MTAIRGTIEVEEVLIELQTRLAFQEESVLELTRTVVRQQREIDLMKQQLAELQHQVQSLEPSPLAGGAAEGEVPPHY